MKLIISLFVLSILIFNTVLAQSKFGSDMSLEEARKPIQIVGEIDTVSEAIQQARNLGLEKQVAFEDLKVRGITEWRVEANLRKPGYHVSFFEIQKKNGIISPLKFEELKKEDLDRPEYWKVTYFSVGIIPSYTCSMGIDRKGTQVKGFFNTCGWDK